MKARLTSLVLLLLGGVLAVVATAQPWWRALGDGVNVRFTGTESTGGLGQALAVVVLAGWVLMLVLRVTGRRILAVLLVLAGLGAGVLGGLRQRPAAAAVRDQVHEVSLLDQFALHGTPWPYVFAGAGLLVAVSSALILATAARWPQRTARFERTPEAAAADAAAGDVFEDPASAWKALDAGLDPTADPAPSRPQ